MRLTDHSSTVALVVSLLLHGSVLHLCRHAASDILPEGRENTVPIRSRVLVDSASGPQLALELPRPELKDLPEDPPRADEDDLESLKEIEPELIIPPTIAPEKMPPLVASGFGELTGSADATALQSLTGDKPMQAPRGERDQPHTNREEASAELPGEESARPKSLRESTPTKAPEPEPRERVELALAGTLVKPDPSPAPSQGVSSNPSRAGENGDADASRRNIGNPDAPAPVTGSDSDPFSVEGAVEFRPGAVVAKFGRRVKTVRPRLSLAGRFDLLALTDPRVVMKVRADETGQVREVTIIKSSGSREIDQPCQLAMYEWWFEPPRDASGKPLPSEMIWTISFVGR